MGFVVKTNIFLPINNFRGRDFGLTQVFNGVYINFKHGAQRVAATKTALSQVHGTEYLNGVYKGIG